MRSRRQRGTKVTSVQLAAIWPKRLSIGSFAGCKWCKRRPLSFSVRFYHTRWCITKTSASMITHSLVSQITWILCAGVRKSAITMSQLGIAQLSWPQTYTLEYENTYLDKTPQSCSEWYAAEASFAGGIIPERSFNQMTSYFNLTWYLRPSNIMVLAVFLIYLNLRYLCSLV